MYTEPQSETFGTMYHLKYPIPCNSVHAIHLNCKSVTYTVKLPLNSIASINSMYVKITHLMVLDVLTSAHCLYSQCFRWCMSNSYVLYKCASTDKSPLSIA